MSEVIKVIIADDHPVFRDGLNVVLRRHEFISKIAQAADGTEVIRILEGEKYDVVLMDINMKPMNGAQATEIIRRRFPEVKVIALSMFGDEHFVNDMISKGASGYLLKNSNRTEIIAAIKSVMKGVSYFSAEVAEFIVERFGEDRSKVIEDSDYTEERLREVIFLISHEKSSKEIAKLMSLSARTIEDCRLDVMKITNSKSVIGVHKYARLKGILDDIKLKVKYGL